MENINRKTNWILLSTSIVLCLLFRLIPFRAPNVEPILSAQMPFSKSYGKLVGFIFGFLSILIFDIATGTLGLWTLVTASSYGIVGVLSASFFNKRSASRKNFVIFAILGTIFYDVFTGLTVGPLLFHQSFAIAFVGQIPFTILHLLGNITFAFFVSPFIYQLTIKYREPSSLFLKKLLVKTL